MKVFMHKYVPHANHLMPRNFGMGIFYIVRNPRRNFSKMKHV